MDNRRFSLEEFAALFPGRFESQDELLREYRSFLVVFEPLDRMPAPPLSTGDKAEIFRRAWQGGRRDWSWSWLDWFRRPAVMFAAGIVLGCVVMFVVLGTRPRVAGPALPGAPVAVDAPLTIEHMGRTQVYKGDLVGRLYPQIENPRIVVEQAEDSEAPQRVLYGTLDDGEVYLVWNL